MADAFSEGGLLPICQSLTILSRISPAHLSYGLLLFILFFFLTIEYYPKFYQLHLSLDESFIWPCWDESTDIPFSENHLILVRVLEGKKKGTFKIDNLQECEFKKTNKGQCHVPGIVQARALLTPSLKEQRVE